MDIIPDFDVSKFYLGLLCNRNHEWGTSGKTLRKKSDWKCPVCVRERVKRYIDADPERARVSRQRASQWYLDNKERHSQNGKEYYQQNKARLLEHNRNYRKNRVLTPEQIKRDREKVRLWFKTPKGKLCNQRRCRKRLAKRRCVHFVDIPEAQLSQHLEAFGTSCPWCNKRKWNTVDHFLPLSKGGSHALFNIVPACRSCNSSKKDRDPKDWYSKQSFYSLRRWRLILKALGKTEATYNQIPLL